MTDIAGLETRISELEARIRVISLNRQRYADGGSTHGCTGGCTGACPDPTGDCTYGCTHGCTDGCTKGCGQTYLPPEDVLSDAVTPAALNVKAKRKGR